MAAPARTKVPNPARDAARGDLVARIRRAIADHVADGGSLDSLTVARLAAIAGISRSTFYVHFADKGGLMLALLDVVEPVLLDAGRPLWSRRAVLSEAELLDGVERIVDVHRTHATELAAISEVRTYDAAVAERHRALVDAVSDDIAAHAAWAQQHGVAASDGDPAEIAFWIARVLFRALPFYLWPADADETDARVGELARVLHRALYARQAAA